MSNITVTKTSTPRINVTLDRGVSGVGIESIDLVFVDPDYFLEFTYTNGTTEQVQLPAATAGVTSFNSRIGVVTLTSLDVTDALGYVPVQPDGTGATGAWSISIAGNAATVTDGVYTTDTGTVTNTMLAGSISNDKLVNSGITINGVITTLGGSINVGTVTSVAATAGTGISITGSPITTSGTIEITNTAPDQVVSLTGAGTASVTGTYPDFTVTTNDQFVGTVTSVGGTGTVNGISLTGTVTESGNLVLGGALTGVDLTTQVAGVLPLANGGTNATTAADARNNLGLGTSAVLDAGSALGVATLDSGGTVPLSQIPASIQGGLIYQGVWNASTNTPTLTSSVGSKGHYYTVSTAGSTNLDGITDWNIGDLAVFNGTIWEQIDNTDAVTSVNGFTGSVSLDYADVGAPSTTGVDATGTWSISVTGNAGTVTNGVYTTDTGTVTNAMLAGSISNDKLVNDNIVINGNDTALGGSVNVGTVTSVAATAGTGISVTGSPITASGELVITNTAPDQVVSLTGTGTTSVTGTYPNFTVDSADQFTGTVTSVSGTGTVNGISLSGTVTDSGNITLGGTLSDVSLTTQVTGTLPIANGGTGATSLTANNVLLGNGTSAPLTVAPGSAGNVLTSDGTTWVSSSPVGGGGGNTIEAIASGSLSDGSAVIIQDDGTVTIPKTPIVTSSTFDVNNTDNMSATYDSINQKVVIAYRVTSPSVYGAVIIGNVSGQSISFGTPVVFNSGNAFNISAIYDNNEQKVVIAYNDGTNSNFGTVIVGAVSGTTISFGTEIVFESSSLSSLSATYDITNQKVVIAYDDDANSSFGTAIVGTVSGTSISFGTPVVFQSIGISNISTTYDTINAKIIISYKNNSTTFGTAIVGTVSGTSISFGSEVVFTNTSVTEMSSIYDNDEQKVIIAYRDLGNSSFGTAIVGTVSGTSISFGTPVVFASSNTSNYATIYDPINQKVVIAYDDNSDSSRGKFVIGAISFANIAFEDPILFSTILTDNISITYDSINQKVVIFYRESSQGRVVIADISLPFLSLESYIGISNGAYANGQIATIQIIGAVDDAQTGLTAGLKYYVQANGSLETTPDLVSVFAGTAISSNKLIIKG